MTKEDLKEVLEKHKKWVDGEVGGECADLRGANLQRANLQDAYLRSADLRGANLQDADLQGTNLYCANLYCANLHGANLYHANLSYADLQGADLQGANLQSANLGGVILDLESISTHIHYLSIVPESGPFWVYKAARCSDTLNVVIVKLEVPETAKRLGGIRGRKCRVSEARVIEITWPDGSVFTGECQSDHDSQFKYQAGEVVFPDRFDDNPLIECAPGIHVFLTRQEAINYL